jgi:hypothetical protein
VLVHLDAQSRQRLREVEHPLVLGALADLPEGRVVAVLLAALGVAPGGLQMAVRVRADPNVRVGGRDRELADPVEGRRVLHLAAVRLHVGEALAGLLAADPGLLVGDVAQPGGFRGLARIDDRFCGRGIEEHEGLPGA